MSKFNSANILSSLKQVEQLAGQIDTAYDAVIETKYIHLADDNRYSDNDTDENIQGLADDIEVNGLLNALILRKIANNKFKLISGERRFRAVTERLKWKQVRCRVYENITNDQAQLMLHTANLQTREYTSAQKLSFYEDCNELLSKMKTSGEYKGGIQEGIASMLNVSDRQVRTYKTIVENTTPEQRKEIVEGKTSLKEAYKEASSKKAVRKKTGTASGFEKAEPTEMQDDRWIKDTLRSKLDSNEIILYYCLEIPTTAESVGYLKKKYRHSGGTVSFSDGASGYCNWRDKLEITTPDNKIISYSYNEVDALIRNMLRNYELLPLDKFKRVLSSHFTKKQLAELDAKEVEEH